MRVEELQYELPETLIAQEPPPVREAARLLVMERERPQFMHESVRSLPALVEPSLFVFNDTRVLPARLHGTKASGGKVELLLVERVRGEGHEEQWLCMARPLKSLRAGMRVSFGAELEAEIGERASESLVRVTLRGEPSVAELLERFGELPLPPYITRKPGAEDAQRYQTVFARELGAIAAPTAGLHFGEELLTALTSAGHELAYLTLHVGPGTFAPLNADDLREHKMHSERYAIGEATALAIERAKREGRAVLAVGTTVVRTLEGAVRVHGAIVPHRGETALCIYPPYEFRVVEGLVTNFHLPRSTLLALVMAFAGVAPARAAYEEAVRERYRFFSYGDAMFIRPRASAR